MIFREGLISVTGKSLAHYKITSQLGKGSMGEVYQATDKKLDREVAIKVLPEAFARDANRVARFQREAKLLASLNYPVLPPSTVWRNRTAPISMQWSLWRAIPLQLGLAMVLFPKTMF